MLMVFGGILLVVACIFARNGIRSLNRKMPLSTSSYILMFLSSVVVGIIVLLRGVQHESFSWNVDALMGIWIVPFVGALIWERRRGALRSQQLKAIAFVGGLVGIATIIIGLMR